MDVAGAEAGGNSWLVNTLPSVGKALEKNTLDALKVIVPAGGLTSDTSVEVITYDAAGQLDGDYLYLDAESNGALYGVESGWYTADSIFAWEPVECGKTEIGFGRGFNILSDCGATITCAGEVYNQNFDITIASSELGGNTWTGNCSPVDRSLEDISITPPEGGLTSDTSVEVITYDAAGQLKGDYLYLDAESNGALYGVESGWYTAESVFAWEPVACGKTPIKAGQMINILSDCGAIMTIPSAL